MADVIEGHLFVALVLVLLGFTCVMIILRRLGGS